MFPWSSVGKEDRHWGAIIALLGLIAFALVVTFGLGNPLGRAIGKDPFTRVYEDETLRIATTDDGLNLEATAQWAKEYLDALDATFGLGTPKVEVRLFSSVREYQQYCQTYVSGFNKGMVYCYSRRLRTVLGPVMPKKRMKSLLQHELFHAVAHQSLPNMALWVEEGIAEYLEDCRIDDQGILNLEKVQIGWMRMAYKHRKHKFRNPEALPSLNAKGFYNPRDRIWYALSYATALYVASTSDLSDLMLQPKVEVIPPDYRDFIASKRWREQRELGQHDYQPWQLATRRAKR